MLVGASLKHAVAVAYLAPFIFYNNVVLVYDAGDSSDRKDNGNDIRKRADRFVCLAQGLLLRDDPLLLSRTS